MKSNPTPPTEVHKVTGEEARVLEGWEHVFPLFVRRTHDGWQVEAYWGRLLLSLVLMLGLGWTALTGGVWLYFKYQRDFADAGYAHLLLYFLPSEREAFQTDYGDFFIKKAQDDMAAGKYGRAYLNVQWGMGKSPRNQAGRLLLAQFKTALHLTEEAQQLLLDGLPYHQDNPDYLRTLFSFLLQQQQDRVVIETARKLLTGTPPTPTTAAGQLRHQLIALEEATAHYYRGNYDQAEDLIRTYQLEQSPEGRLLSIRIEWERGNRAVALTRLREMELSPQLSLPETDEIYAQIVAWLREMGNDNEARYTSVQRQITDPTNARPRINLLYAYQKKGDTASLADGIETIMHDFATDNGALVALADFAANTGDVALARRVYEHCRDDPNPEEAKRLNSEYPALMLVEAQVVARDYHGSIETARLLRVAHPDWAKRFDPVFNGLNAIASFGLGDEAGGQLALNAFMRLPNVRANNLVAVSKRLFDVGARDQARLVLAQASKVDPLNQGALTSLVKLDVEMSDADALAASLPRLLQMRKPDPEVLQSAYARLGSDLFLFHPERTVLLQNVRTALNEAKARLSNGG